MGNLQRKRKVNIDIPIVIVIAGLMLLLINFSDDKLDELIVSDAEVLFMDIDHDPSDQMHTDLAERIEQFRPGVYKMIEVYDGQLNEIVSIQFDDDDKVEGNTITDYPELTNLLLNNHDGHTSREIGESIEYIYFKWSFDEDNNPYLFIIYTYKPIVKNFWVFHLICYSILVLVCVLLIRAALRNRAVSIKLYDSLVR